MSVLEMIGCKHRYVACDFELREIAETTSFDIALNMFSTETMLGTESVTAGWVFRTDMFGTKQEGWLVNNGNVVIHETYYDKNFFYRVRIPGSSDGIIRNAVSHTCDRGLPLDYANDILKKHFDGNGIIERFELNEQGEWKLVQTLVCKRKKQCVS